MMDLVWWEIAILVVAGFGAGLVNVMAGGGSILTVPIMMFLGMPGPVANGTNRITIVAHNASAMVTYLKHGIPHAKLCLTLTLVAIPPAILGAWLSTKLNNEQFEGLLAIVMVAVLILMQAPQAKKVGSHEDQPQNLALGHVLMAAAGFWGGVYSNRYGVCGAAHYASRHWPELGEHQHPQSLHYFYLYAARCVRIRRNQ